ncbi:MAG: hypothetical protein EHM36_07615 [Deltaproteobacteria bacterium]|nr:MAG: hypothetical protein EHM36_07615 [Deltaproteobacteria bacterium]
MIRSFLNVGTEDIFNRVGSKEARFTCPKKIWSVAQRKLDQLNAVVSLNSLRVPPGNKLEALKGNRQGQYSIRINDQFRICFTWTPDGPERVEISDYHLGSLIWALLILGCVIERSRRTWFVSLPMGRQPTLEKCSKKSS